MKIFCPYIQSQCSEGNITEHFEEQKCVMWSAQMQVCLLISYLKRGEEQARLLEKMRAKWGKSAMDKFLEKL